MKKLMEELESNGFEKFKDNSEQYSLEKIEELNYLNYVIKESLRIDPPLIFSLTYKAYTDVTI